MENKVTALAGRYITPCWPLHNEGKSERDSRLKGHLFLADFTVAPGAKRRACTSSDLRSVQCDGYIRRSYVFTPLISHFIQRDHSCALPA